MDTDTKAEPVETSPVAKARKPWKGSSLMNLAAVLRLVQRVLAAVAVTVVAVVGVTAGPSTTTTASDAVASPALELSAVSARPAYSTTTYESQVKYYVNVERRKRGLPALRWASCTDAAAERWASYLASHNAFYHQSMTSLLRRCNARYAGETLAKGNITPRTLVTMWMNSPAHRHVMLSTSPRRIGIGAVPNSHGQWVVAANYMRF
jgi:uncharacterized protein YkwD